MHPSDPRTSSDVVAEALREHRGAFEGFVRARVRPDRVDDIVQLVALRAMERAHTLEHPERVVAWLYRIHRNLIIDDARRTATESRLVVSGAALPEPAVAVSDDPCSCSVIQSQRLRPTYASILTMVDSEGVAIPEAADALGITTNNATVRLHRARRALKAAMLEHCGVTDPSDCAACRCVDDVCCDAA